MITLKDVKAATIAVTNESEESRAYAISAEAKFQDKKVTHIEHGKVVALTADKTELATFSTWNEKNVNLNINDAPADEHGALIQAINTFIAELRATPQPTVAITE